jgi:hypothetical protein
VLNAQDVFLEDAGDINLECHRNHRPFEKTGWEINRDVFTDGSQQGFTLSLHVSSMATVTEVMRSDLLF